MTSQLEFFSTSLMNFFSDVVTRLVELLNSNEVSVITPALRAIGNIVTGDDSQTQCILDHGALPAFHNLLKHHKINIQKEAAWTISNITAGNTNQIQQVLDQQLLPPVLEILTKVGNSTNTAKALESFLSVWTLVLSNQNRTAKTDQGFFYSVGKILQRLPVW